MSQLLRHNLTIAGYLAPIPASNSASASAAALIVDRAVDRAQTGGDLLAVVVRSVTERGP